MSTGLLATKAVTRTMTLNYTFNFVDISTVYLPLVAVF
jgi:hypothetical protein